MDRRMRARLLLVEVSTRDRQRPTPQLEVSPITRTIKYAGPPDPPSPRATQSTPISGDFAAIIHIRTISRIGTFC